MHDAHFNVIVLLYLSQNYMPVNKYRLDSTLHDDSTSDFHCEKLKEDVMKLVRISH